MKRRQSKHPLSSLKSVPKSLLSPQPNHRANKKSPKSPKMRRLRLTLQRANRKMRVENVSARSKISSAIKSKKPLLKQRLS